MICITVLYHKLYVIYKLSNTWWYLSLIRFLRCRLLWTKILCWCLFTLPILQTLDFLNEMTKPVKGRWGKLLNDSPRLTDHWTPERVWEGDRGGEGPGSSVSEALVWIWVVGQPLPLIRKPSTILIPLVPQNFMVYYVFIKRIFFIHANSIWFYFKVHESSSLFCLLWYIMISIFHYLASHLTLHWIAW